MVLGSYIRIETDVIQIQISLRLGITQYYIGIYTIFYWTNGMKYEFYSSFKLMSVIDIHDEVAFGPSNLSRGTLHQNVVYMLFWSR